MTPGPKPPVPPEMRRDHQEEIRLSLILLRSLHSTVTGLLEDLIERKPDTSITTFAKKQRELETAVKDAREMEKRLDALDKAADQSRYDSGHAIDFERLEHEIRSRIDRIVDARREGRLPDGDEPA